jgi:predicted CXXCH cytochrome family protein
MSQPSPVSQPSPMNRITGSGKLVKEKLPHRLFISLCLSIGVLLILFYGCDPHTRHDVLSVFFTGVPTPEEQEEMRENEELERKMREEEKKIEEEMRKALKQSPDQKEAGSALQIFTHESYAAGRCDPCHMMNANITMLRRDRSTARFTRGGGKPGILVAPRQKLCTRCHENLSASGARAMGLWLHTAVARGDWNTCHDPHQSEYPHILLNNTQVICLKCHPAKDITGTRGHENIENCIGCHNPHLGKDRLMLTKDYKEEKYEPKHLPDAPSSEARKNATQKEPLPER